MALVIEDGSLIANANSYVTAAETRAYASARGATVPTNDADLERLLVQAIDYLEAQRSRFKGSRVDASQSLQWPRQDVLIDGFEFAIDDIPIELKRAQMQLAIEAAKGIDLQPSRSGSFVKLEKVGPIETQYSEKLATSYIPSMTAVDALLAPLIAVSGQGAFLSSVRI